jgi:hypothetical protein
MKNYLIISIIAFLPLAITAQSAESGRRLGANINSSINGELYAFMLTPCFTYTKGKSQLEFGVGLNLNNRLEQSLWSSELNYKFYPNGMGNKFNLYFLTQFAFLNRTQHSYYPANYNYLFVNGGYGLEIKVHNKIYLGSHISVGAFSYGKTSENPHLDFSKNNMFDEIGINLTFQINVGYRF